MKAFFLFTASGPVVILTSYESIEAPGLFKNLSSRGISKFIACEVPVELAKDKYTEHFDVVRRFLRDKDDLRVLDYSGQRAFGKFKFNELGNPTYHE